LYSELGYAVTDKYRSYTHQLVQAYESGEDINNVSLAPVQGHTTNRVFKNVDGISFKSHRRMRWYPPGFFSTE
jgi:altronate hydrolase